MLSIAITDVYIQYYRYMKQRCGVTAAMWGFGQAVIADYHHPRRAVDAGQWLCGNGWQGPSVVMGAAALWAWLAGYQVSLCRAAAPPAFLQQPAEVELLVQFPQVVLRGAKKITANAVMRYSGVYICKCAVCSNVKQYQYEKVVCYVRFRLCNFIIFILFLKFFLYNLLFADNFVNIKMFKRRIFSCTA